MSKDLWDLIRAGLPQDLAIPNPTTGTLGLPFMLLDHDWPDTCWIWQKTSTSNGAIKTVIHRSYGGSPYTSTRRVPAYGTLCHRGEVILVHKVIWQFAFQHQLQDLPDGREEYLQRLCGVDNCVNPLHWTKSSRNKRKPRARIAHHEYNAPSDPDQDFEDCCDMVEEFYGTYNPSSFDELYQHFEGSFTVPEVTAALAHLGGPLEKLIPH